MINWLMISTTLAAALVVAGCAQTGSQSQARPSTEDRLEALAASDPAGKQTAAGLCAGTLIDAPEGGPSIFSRRQLEAAVAVGWQAVEAERPGGAVYYFGAALTDKPRNFEAYWGLAVASHMIGYEPKIVDGCLALAEKGMGDIAEFYADAGKIWGERGEIDRAEGALKTALKLKPEHLPTYAHLIALEHNRGNEAAAERYARDAEKYLPK